MPPNAAESHAAADSEAAKQSETGKPANGAAVVFDKAAADEKRKSKICERYENGQYVSRTDKQFAGIEDSSVHQSGTVKGYTGVIQHVREHHGVTLHRTQLSAWSYGRSLPQGCTEPFPPLEPPDRHRISTFMRWIVAYIPKPSETAKKNGRNGNLPLTDYIGERQRLAMERERKELLWAEQEKGEKYVLRTDSEAALEAVVQKFRSIIRNAWRRQLKADMQAELRSHGFTDQQMAAIQDVFGEVGRKIIRNIEDACEKA